MQDQNKPSWTEENTVTADGLAALTAELAELEGQGRREIADRIRVAREWGDLKENSEYHDAKNDQTHFETKIARLREKIASAVVVERVSGGETVGFGSKVVVEGDNGKRQTWQIVSSHEASPADGRLSVASPMARALAGCRVGDETTIALPRGEQRLTVLSIE